MQLTEQEKQKRKGGNVQFSETQWIELFIIVLQISFRGVQMNTYKKVNTFTRIPSATQIIAYLVVLLQIVTFFVIIQARFLAQTTQIVMIVLYSLATLIQIISTFACAAIDPSDTFMIRYLNNPQIQSQQISELLYCDDCQSYVQITARHCRSCGRCCEGFDHHCRWINNCIGSLNYRLFIVMISSTFCSKSLYLIGVGLLWGQNNWDDFLGEMISLWCISVIVVFFAIMLLNLMIFHIYLNCRGLTTFDFVMISREQEKLKKEQENNDNNKNLQNQMNTLNITQQHLQETKQEFPNQYDQDKVKKFLKENQETKRQYCSKLPIDMRNSIETHMRQQSKKNTEFNISKKTQSDISSVKSDIVHSSDFTLKNKSLTILVDTDAGLPHELDPDKIHPKSVKNLHTNNEKSKQSSFGKRPNKILPKRYEPYYEDEEN